MIIYSIIMIELFRIMPFLIFLIGERGVGKTFGASEFVLVNLLKKVMNLYIRRYKTDLEKGKKKFFKALINEGKFENHKLEGKR